ncbi:MAG: hypothetical protein AB1640_00245 [bacterium]
MDSALLGAFARPVPGLRVRDWTLALTRPSKEEIESFPVEAAKLLDRTWEAQKSLLASGPYDLKWAEETHFLLAGATGSGLGGALACAVLNLLGRGGSLTVISRDLKRSVGYESGAAMERRAQAGGLANRFHWSNRGLAFEGKDLESIVLALREAGAGRIVYINTVAAAISGVRPGYPPVYVKDVDHEGLFLWKLLPLDERSLEANRFVMGTLAVRFPQELEKAGFRVEATAFADWRGSLDRISRDPSSPEYGRQGAYSTSLYIPKDVQQEATSAAYGSGKLVQDFFLPVMRTRALSFVPGGMAMSRIYDRLMELEGVRRLDVPELALAMLDRIGRAIRGEDRNPFPRLDGHEARLDLWFLEVVMRLHEGGGDEGFHFARWL